MSMVSPAGSEPGYEKFDRLQVPDGTTEALLNRLAKPPRTWVGLMLLAALLATFDVRQDAAGGHVISFHVGTESLISLGLMWLPLLLRVFALVGGSFKAAGVEASVLGVLTRAEAIDLSVKARQVTSAGDEQERRVAAQDLEESINRLVLPSDRDATIAEAPLLQLARDYERLRRDLSPGSRRTSAMTRVVNEARARAALEPRSARLAASVLLRSKRPGDRIVGLGLTQETGDTSAFESVLGMVSGSASAFEMFQALLALQELSFALTSAQVAQALQTLHQEEGDPRSTGISADPGLPALLARTQNILAARE